VGLKLLDGSGGHVLVSSSNRTIVGLKPNLVDKLVTKVGGSNRTIVGLKPPSRQFANNFVNCSNRTIVGLKQWKKDAFPHGKLSQQSHHCGIETCIVVILHSGNISAAIAPLWD